MQNLDKWRKQMEHWSHKDKLGLLAPFRSEA